MSDSSKGASPVCKTAFVVLWDKAIENMGIKVNWNDIEYMKGQLETAFRDLSPNFYAAICKAQKNDGTSGYHVHLAQSYDKARRIKSIAKDLGNAHCEIMRGTKEQALNYINKGEGWEEKDEEIIVKFGDPTSITDNSGTRLDLKALEISILSGDINSSNIDKKALELGKTTYQIEEIKKFFMQVTLANAPKDIRNVKVIYVEGKAGTGKSWQVLKQYKDVFRASVDHKSNFPLDGYMGQKVLWLDELRPGDFNNSFLKEILDIYPMIVNVKGGHMPALWNTVIITTAFPFDQWYNDQFKGQDNEKEQFIRRIHERYRTVVDETELDQYGKLVTKKSHWEKIPWENKNEFRPLTKEEEKELPFT